MKTTNPATSNKRKHFSKAMSIRKNKKQKIFPGNAKMTSKSSETKNTPRIEILEERRHTLEGSMMKVMKPKTTPKKNLQKSKQLPVQHPSMLQPLNHPIMNKLQQIEQVLQC